MSRSDQWIGMTDDGKKWFNEQGVKYGFVKTKKPIGYYAFLEPHSIPGKEIHIDNMIYREHIQATPWSSGPMYFIDIEVIKDNKTIGYMFSWKEKPLLDETRYIESVDYEKGEFLV